MSQDILLGDWKTRNTGTTRNSIIFANLVTCATYFGSSSYNLAMCINCISGLPSRALSRAEQFKLLLKINLDVDVDIELLLVNDQIILQRIVRQSARISLGGIQKDIFYENYCSCLTD